MKFSLKNSGAENPVNLMRKAGYFFLEEGGSDLSFVRPMERSGYPRFHIYLRINKFVSSASSPSRDSADEINKEADEIVFNLHLDQKRPVYKGVSAHAGEYDGETVEREAERIKTILGK